MFYEKTYNGYNVFSELSSFKIGVDPEYKDLFEIYINEILNSNYSCRHNAHCAWRYFKCSTQNIGCIDNKGNFIKVAYVIGASDEDIQKILKNLSNIIPLYTSYTGRYLFFTYSSNSNYEIYDTYKNTYYTIMKRHYNIDNLSIHDLISDPYDIKGPYFVNHDFITSIYKKNNNNNKIDLIMSVIHNDSYETIKLAEKIAGNLNFLEYSNKIENAGKEANFRLKKLFGV